MGRDCCIGAVSDVVVNISEEQIPTSLLLVSQPLDLNHYNWKIIYQKVSY